MSEAIISNVERSRLKYRTTKCPHGRGNNGYYCVPCGKGGTCIHNRVKHYCNQCPGSKGICPHGKQKPACRLCKGSSICEHNKMRYYCNDCRKKMPLSEIFKKYKHSCIICGSALTTPLRKLERLCGNHKKGPPYKGLPWIGEIVGCKYEHSFELAPLQYDK